MIEAIIEARLLVAAVVAGALVSIAAFSVADTGAERVLRVGELTGAQWALVETSELCDHAGGQWSPPGTCSPAS